MAALRILEGPGPLSWGYDEQGDVLYISIGAPRPVVSLDVGASVLIRFDEKAGEVVGITLMDVRQRLLQALATRGAA